MDKRSLKTAKDDENISIIQNNLESAPIYRYYQAEKRFRNSQSLRLKTERALSNVDSYISQKRKHDKFYLMKWDIFRQLIDYVID